ncbi:hypothetical protein HZF02_32300 (plasmid) [Pseudomonas yamanorum]|nr:hypothetical protein HZF02_32300 [Pseudomonas yamanorum]
MVLNLATYTAHDGYINHVMACRLCHPPTKRYCFEGLQLHDEYLAQYLMSQDLYTHRAFLSALETTDLAHCEALKTRMLAIFEEKIEAEP